MRCASMSPLPGERTASSYRCCATTLRPGTNCVRSWDGTGTRPTLMPCGDFSLSTSGQVRWGRTPSQGIFHPKVFLFHHGERITALVGSANLTQGGFLRNVEAIVRLSGTAGELEGLVQFFEGEWDQAEIVDEANL